MSATNRGATRNKADFYPTPPEVIHNYLNANPIAKLDCNILEPCAGSGNIVTILKNRGYTNVDAVEIREEEKEFLENRADNVYIGDFLMMEGLANKYDVIITNPPYNLAQQFIEKSLDIVKPNGKVIMLLRTNFLESKKRFEFWQKNPPSRLYVLSQRPSFTGKGTDATSYSWFVWDKSVFGCNQKIKVI